MNGKPGTNKSAKRLARREMIAGVAVACGALAAGSSLLGGESRQQPVAETPGRLENKNKTALHQESPVKASAERVYEALLDSRRFAGFTGAPAEIDAKAGGAFSLFGGLIVGRNIELVPSRRIVQAWRPTHWDPGSYSIVKFEFIPKGPETLLVLDHSSFPPGEYDSLSQGWTSHYWDALAKYFG